MFSFFFRYTNTPLERRIWDKIRKKLLNSAKKVDKKAV